MEKVVKSVKQVGDFESQYGHFYKWLLEFEDGFKGEYLSKTETQNKFIEGQDSFNRSNYKRVQRYYNQQD